MNKAYVCCCERFSVLNGRVVGKWLYPEVVDKVLLMYNSGLKIDTNGWMVEEVEYFDPERIDQVGLKACYYEKYGWPDNSQLWSK